MANQNQPKPPDSNRLAQIERQLSITQLRYLVARVDAASDKEAADMIGIKPSTVKTWNEDGSKALIDEAVRLMVQDGIVTALELRRRNLAKAMAVKVKGLDSNDEKVRQNTATEIIEWELGKATQKSELTGKDGENVKIFVTLKGKDE